MLLVGKTVDLADLLQYLAKNMSLLVQKNGGEDFYLQKPVSAIFREKKKV